MKDKPTVPRPKPLEGVRDWLYESVIYSPRYQEPWNTACDCIELEIKCNKLSETINYLYDGELTKNLIPELTAAQKTVDKDYNQKFKELTEWLKEHFFEQLASDILKYYKDE